VFKFLYISFLTKLEIIFISAIYWLLALALICISLLVSDRILILVPLKFSGLKLNTILQGVYWRLKKMYFLLLPFSKGNTSGHKTMLGFNSFHWVLINVPVTTVHN